MQHTIKLPVLRYAAFLGFASIALACSKKSGGSDPAPAAPTTVTTPAQAVTPPTVGAPTTAQSSSTVSTVAGTADVTTSGSGGQTTVGGGGGGGSAVVVPTAPPAPLDLQIGNFYSFTVPAGMHVTEYATNKTFNTTLSFIRVSPQSDPVYLGNYACDATFDGSFEVNLSGPSGHVYKYCQSTPTEREYKKYLTSTPLANNHLEVATNIENVTNENQTYIDINVFDSDYEYMYGETRFEQLCRNSIGGISTTPPGATFFPLLSFWGLPVFAQFVMCTAAIQLPTGAAFAGIDTHLWRNTVAVGSFMISSSSSTAPDINCFTSRNCTGYTNANMVEVTIVSKTSYTSPAFFAHDAQTLFNATLQRIN